MQTKTQMFFRGLHHNFLSVASSALAGLWRLFGGRLAPAKLGESCGNFGANLGANRREDSRPAQNILILRTDAIGDYLLFRDFLAEVKRANPRARLTFLGNIAYKDLAECLECEVVDSFIWLDLRRFRRRFCYAIGFLARLKMREFDILLNPMYSRNRISAFISREARARAKFAAEGDSIHMPSALKQRTNRYFTLLPSTPKIIFEFERNREFFEAFLGKKLATKPFIDRAKLAAAANKSLKAQILGGLDLRDSQDWRQDSRGGDSRDLRDSQLGAGLADSPRRDLPPQDSQDSHPKTSPDSPPRFCVLFIGASAAFRKYSPLGFAQVGAFVAQKYGLKIVLTSGKEDAAVGKIIECELAKSRIAALNLVAQTTLSELGFVIAHAALLVSNETSAAHLGAILKTPTIVLSNGSSFGRFVPYPRDLAMDYVAIFCKGFEEGVGDCGIDSIEPSRVISAIEGLWAGNWRN